MATHTLITLGNSGKDYTSLDGACAGTEVINRVTNDEFITIECYNTNDLTIDADAASIAAGASANRVTIRPAVGEDYAANDYTSKALNYNPADGVAIEATGPFASALILDGVSSTQVVNMQFFCPEALHAGSVLHGNDGTSQFYGCIIQNAKEVRQTRADYRNCLFIRPDTLGTIGLDLSFSDMNQCTIVCPSDLTSTAAGVSLHASPTFNECAIFGFDSATSGTAGTSDYNATDNSSIPGSNSLTSQTYADQFENTTDAAQDWRLKTGNDLDGAGSGGIDIGYRIPEAIAAAPILEEWVATDSSGNLATSLTLTAPSGISADDLLVIIVGNDAINTTTQFSTSASGWTKIGEGGDGTNNSDVHIGAFYKVASGSEGNITIDGVTSSEMVGWYLKISGAATSGPIDVSNFNESGAATEHNIASITTTVDDCLVLYGLIADGGDNTPMSVLPLQWIERDENESGTGLNDVAGCFGEHNKQVAGATIAADVTITTSGGAAWFQLAIKPSGGLSAVTSDSTLEWNLLEALTNDSNLQWNLLNSTENDADLQWNLLTSLENDSDLRWTLLEGVSSNSDLRWTLLESLSSDSTLQWNLLTSTTSDSTLQWSLTSGVSSNSTLQWDLLTTVSSDSDIQWTLLASLSSDTNLQWNLIEGVSSDSVLQWHIEGPVFSDINIQWDMLAPVEGDSDLQWDILKTLSGDSTLQWSLLSGVESDSDIQWNILDAITSDSTAQWDLLNTVEGDSDIRWNMLASLSADSDIQWNLLSSTTSDTDIRWDLLTSVSSDNDLRWTLLESLFSDTDIQWNLIATALNDSSLQWDILTTTEQDASLQWDLLNDLLSDTDIRWDLIAGVLNDSTLIWTLNTSSTTVQSDSDLRWNILISTYSDITANWDLLQEINSNSTLQWTILSTTENTMTLRWTVDSVLSFGDAWGIITIKTNTPLYEAKSNTPIFTLAKATKPGA